MFHIGRNASDGLKIVRRLGQHVRPSWTFLQSPVEGRDHGKQPGASLSGPHPQRMPDANPQDLLKLTVTFTMKAGLGFLALEAYGKALLGTVQSILAK